MKICVYGLWHLGTVSAACLAHSGFDVVGLDADEKTIASLVQGKAAIFEPGLDKLIVEGQSSGRLRFTTNAQDALGDADLLWITFDTPVDDEDRADVEFVFTRVADVLSLLPAGAAIVVSSQVPVGFTERVKQHCLKNLPDKGFRFAYSPENLRLGNALQSFLEPDRIVVGTDTPEGRQFLEPVFQRLCERIEWMSVSSAEMTKHAINAFLATSIVFANELASVCEKVGADAKEVERGLKSEARIGKKAYLGPGPAFSGGTLARDVQFLKSMGRSFDLSVPLFDAVMTSNDYHKGWAARQISQYFPSSGHHTFALLGLTYKPGTDTLRRSWSIDLARHMWNEGYRIRAYDPKVSAVPDELKEVLVLCDTPEEALKGSDFAVVGTNWPEFLDLSPTLFLTLSGKTVVDATGFLQTVFQAGDKSIRHIMVGRVK
ncbi:MAG: UDP-glucose/GDP-mannose dehydrogenase family protein [Firmicutes bacterium]|nr:UDP-glucose/GDP-mannose dehydrogenase family protein [Bacillota bacterium]